MMELKPHQVYKLHYLMDDPKLSGKAIVFYEERVFTTGDSSRCRVKLISNDEEYLVLRSCIISI